jgi:predicted lactoylglutathione lyase
MNIFKRIFRFYYEGFRTMPKWGRQAWAIIIVKGILIFVLVKFIFFPDFLKKNFDTDEERSEYVLEQLTKKHNNDTTKH